MSYLKNIIIIFAICFGLAFPAYAVGTSAGSVMTASASVSTVYNATAAWAQTATNSTVLAVYGFATAAYVEESAKSASAGGTATYDFVVVNAGNTAAPVVVKVGPQSFSGPAGNTGEWGVAAENVGVGFVPFAGSATMTATQGATDTATAAASLAADATATVRLHNRTSPSAVDTGSSNYSVSFSTTNFPGAAYTGYNGTVYAGPASWSRLLDGGFVITTINGVVLNATKTVAVTAPASYVASGGLLADIVPGATVTFTMSFSNNGSVPALGAIILDDLPTATATTYVTGSIRSCFSGSACVTAADPDADAANPDCYYISGPTAQVRCDVDSLGAGGGGVFQYSVTIN